MYFTMQTQSPSPAIQRMFGNAFREPPTKKKPKPGLKAEGRYSSSDAARKAGCTLRQLQWWDEKGIVSPTAHAKHQREYSEADIARLKIVGRLRKCGISLQAIRKLLKRAPFVIPAGRYALTDGKTAIECGDAEQVVGYMSVSRNPLLLIDRGPAQD